MSQCAAAFPDTQSDKDSNVQACTCRVNFLRLLPPVQNNLFLVAFPDNKAGLDVVIKCL